MNHTQPVTRAACAVLAVLWIIFGCALRAQTATGSIQGRVYNPVAKEYVHNAEVRLEGTNQITYTENDGSFRFDNVPAGQATVSVAFTGYNTAKETFTVTAGQTATREINMTSSIAAPAPGEPGVVKLEAFTVASQREGNSKAIMDQRRDMNIKSSVSADTFGDVTDGNVGEFLKYLPGVDLDYVESEPRGPRLGGMDSQYVGVSMDGMRTANADANRGGGPNSRATSFEGFSITSVDSIEINWTASPQDDADSPAGVVNMKTKRAFDRKGRRFDYNIGTNFNSDEFTLSRRVHPDESPRYQWRPNWQFTYADSFLDQKFGILLGYNRGWSVTEQTTETMDYNTNSGNQSTTGGVTPVDTRPMVARQIDYKDGPKWIRKDALLLTADWKVTQRLILSLNMNYSYFAGDFWNRNFTFVAANSNTNSLTGRSTIGGDGLNTIIAPRDFSQPTGLVNGQVLNNNTAALNWGGGAADKMTWSRQYAPRFEYRVGPLTVDGGGAFSKSVNHYEGLITGFSTTPVGGVASGFTATRPNPNSWEWTIHQTSGGDWFNMANYTSTNTQLGGTSMQDRTETWITDKWTGVLNAKYVVPFMERFPTVFRVGGKWDEENRHNHNWNSAAKWAYFGPGGDSVVYNPATETWSISTAPQTYTLNGQTWTTNGISSWANVFPQPSPLKFDPHTTNMFTVYNVNGATGQLPRPNMNDVANLYHAHPELFVNTASVNDYYNAYISPERNFRQTITAGYMQFDTRLTSKLQIRTGVRVEETKNRFIEFNPLTPAEMLNSPFASQFTKNPTTGLVSPNLATSIDGINYQFRTKPKATRTSKYHNWFPSLMTKYTILPNLEWQAGVNKGISRPGVDNLTGLWSVNDNANPPTVTAPNPNLLPENHLKVQTRLAYYFQGRSPGQVSIAFTQDKVKNFISSTTYHGGEAFGVDDPTYSDYDFISTQNDTNLTHRYRNMSLNYQQTLGFLRYEALRGIYIGATYDRSYDNVRHVNLLPRRFSFTPGYTYRRFSGGLGIIWTDDKPSSSTYGEYYGAMTKIDVRASYRISNYLYLYLQVRNITNVKDEFYKSPPGVAEGKSPALRSMEEYGANWVFGIRGTL